MDPHSLQAAYVLHTRRYGDSSLLVDLLTREHGRVACVAKGVLRAKATTVRIQTFAHLLVELRGRGEVLSLLRAEAAGQPVQLLGRALYCGLYINELLLKLTARQDASADLFDGYATAIAGLAGASASEPVLRRFEVSLLQHLGLGLELESDAEGRPIDAAGSYNYDIDSGPRRVSGDGPTVVTGETLLALRNGEFTNDRVAREARLLMRRVINHHLDGRPLRSRELFR
ncbi:MAG: DNA repair protein RecO [Gammaproteobacteria bacterium]|nr:DNA repair protein RecO [Gammaproteobacteria bacterium]